MVVVVLARLARSSCPYRVIHSVRSRHHIGRRSEKREASPPQLDERRPRIATLRLSRLVRGALLRGRCQAKRKKGEPIRFGSAAIRLETIVHQSRTTSPALFFVARRRFPPSARALAADRGELQVAFLLFFFFFFFFVSLTNSWLAVRIFRTEFSAKRFSREEDLAKRIVSQSRLTKFGRLVIRHARENPKNTERSRPSSKD